MCHSRWRTFRALRVTYADGRPKLSFELAQGRVQGVYRAFHPLGRRAVEQTYNAGSPEGIGRFGHPEDRSSAAYRTNAPNAN